MALNKRVPCGPDHTRPDEAQSRLSACIAEYCTIDAPSRDIFRPPLLSLVIAWLCTEKVVVCKPPSSYISMCGDV